MIRYYDLGSGRRISEIVFAGSHDASISKGAPHAKTQKLNIIEQAAVGVRLFDLRILARSKGLGYELVGYHGVASGKKTKSMDRDNRSYDDVQYSNHMLLGTFGLRLIDMLEQGRTFVRNHPEFLIFKFDKCKNYQVIADYCVDILGKNILKMSDGDHFGRLTLHDLRHKVVCVFNEDGADEIKGLGPKNGILKFRNLKNHDPSTDPYDPAFRGLQFYGKGGTGESDFDSFNKKRKENFEKQKGLMSTFAHRTDVASYALGVMYWTATGRLQNIKWRDNSMWGKTGIKQMEQLWTEALEDSISMQMQQSRIKKRKYGGATRLKAFFPNVVMVDFASSAKCRTVYELNHLADEKLADAYEDWHDKHHAG